MGLRPQGWKDEGDLCLLLKPSEDALMGQLGEMNACPLQLGARKTGTYSCLRRSRQAAG